MPALVTLGVRKAQGSRKPPDKEKSQNQDMDWRSMAWMRTPHSSKALEDGASHQTRVHRNQALAADMLEVNIARGAVVPCHQIRVSCH